MILRNHGLLTAGGSVAEAFILMHNLERACRVQVTIQSTGRDVNPVAPEVAQLTAQQYERGDSNRRTGHIQREWSALLRYLEPPVPGSYRD
jgi:ribulose-5-phosphate 4-epimerase/fuculose-1-phosphate aldolase